MSRGKTWLGGVSLVSALLGCSGDDEAPAPSMQPSPGPASMQPSTETAAPSPGPSAPAAAPGASESEPMTGTLPLEPASPPPAPTPGGAPPDAEAPVAAPQGEPVQAPLPALPAVRQEHAVVALDGEIYVIGGFTPMVTASVEAFDTRAQTWRSVAALPAALHHANAASINGRIYVAGFYLGGSFTNADPRVLEYDPAQDTWTERSPMPGGTQRATGCVASFDGKLFVFGGARATTVADASFYDVAADAWTALPPLPEPREHCVAGEVAGTLIIASGRAGGITGFQPNTWAFDPVAQTYTPRAAIPTPRGGTAGAVLGERLYIFGGEGNPGNLGVWPNVDSYDPATDTWQALPAMLTPRHGFGAAASDGRIYLPGGALVQGFGAAADHTVLSFGAP
jgi:hypothetical protein